MAGSVAREGEPAAEHNAVVVDRLIAAGRSSSAAPT